MKSVWTVIMTTAIICTHFYSTAVEYRIVTGHEVRPYLPQVAELTVKLLADYPFLYNPEGGAQAEDVDCYYKSPDTLMVGAFDDQELVAVVIGVPLEQFEDKPYGFFPETSLAPVISDLQGYFYVALLLVEKAYRHQGTAHCLMNTLQELVCTDGRYTHLCALVLELDYTQETPPPAYDFYYERGYQWYFQTQQWDKHEPLIAYCAGGTPHMRFWSKQLNSH